MHCATCGAPVDLESQALGACQYCKTVLVKEAPRPPSLEGALAELLHAAAHQGGASNIVVVQGTTISSTIGELGSAPLPCPHCAHSLSKRRVGEAQLAACGTCRGIWLDSATVHRLRNAHDEEIERAARGLGGRELAPAARNRTGPLLCPDCQGPLRRVDIPNTMYTVDTCDAHGTWFDRFDDDELQVFVTAFEEARAGKVTDEDLRNAGVGGGFFARLFRSGG